MSLAPYRAVVVGTDGSSLAEPTVRRAAQLAVREQAVLYIVCAFTPITRRTEAMNVATVGGDPAVDQVAGKSSAAIALEEAAAFATEEGAEIAATRLVDGPAAAALLHVVEEQSADLLVVGAVRDRSIAGRLLGTVAEEVLRKASCDVLIIRPCDDATVTGRPEDVTVDR